MDKKIGDLERTINNAEAQSQKAWEELSRIRARCQHEWGPVWDCSKTIPEYTIPGDEPGTMGVDFRPGCYVPPQRIEKWKRTCRKCGLTQETTNTVEQVTKTPKF